MDRRNFLAALAAATMSAAVGAESQTSDRRPNVLLLMSDEHKRSCMGAYGDPVAKTSNLDRLAAQSMRFTNAYCTNPVHTVACVPDDRPL